MTPARRSNLAFAAVAVLVVAVVAVVHAVRLVEPLGIDQGLFACFARWVPRGWMPYRDLFDSKPPLFLYWWALSAVLPGDVVRAAWWLEGLWLAATLALVFSAVSRLWGRWAGLCAAALLFAGLWAPGWGGFWSRAQAEELLALPMIGSAWLAWRALDRPPLALWAGALVGVCGLFKIPSMAVALAWTVTWIACLSGRAALRRTALLVGGVVGPWALAFAWFAAHGATSSFVEGVFVYHRYNASFIAPPWGGVLQEFAATMASQATFPLVAAAFGVVRLARRRAREVHWVASWIVATMAAVVLQRQLAGYHYILVMPALAVAGAYGLVDLARLARDRPDAKGVAALCLLVIAGFGIREGWTWVRAYEPDAACFSGRLPRDAYLLRIQQGGFSMATEEQAARYIRERTAPSDGILVWGLSPGIYALADRHPVTSFPFHKILMTDAPLSRMWPGLPERRARLVEALRSEPPRYILVGRGDQNGFEPLDSYTSMMRFPELRGMLEREYRLETQIGRFLVFRR